MLSFDLAHSRVFVEDGLLDRRPPRSRCSPYGFFAVADSSVDIISVSMGWNGSTAGRSPPRAAETGLRLRPGTIALPPGSSMFDPPTLDDLRAAGERLHGLAVATPLLEYPMLNERLGRRVLLKAENLQRVGSFKFRGAYNRIVQAERARFPGGVVACSSGNHAQGVAAAAQLLGLRALLPSKDGG